MKKVLSVVAFCMSAISLSYAADDLKYGSSLLDIRFNEYLEKYEACQVLARQTLLSEEDIQTLSKLSKEAGIALGFYNYKAIEGCSKDEYLALLTTLLSLEIMNRDAQSPAISKKIRVIKSTLFTFSMIDLEESYVDLPKQVVDTVGEISGLRLPFNQMDAYDRAWPN
jgi:hypothetical protein